MKTVFLCVLLSTYFRTIWCFYYDNNYYQNDYNYDVCCTDNAQWQYIPYQQRYDYLDSIPDWPHVQYRPHHWSFQPPLQYDRYNPCQNVELSCYNVAFYRCCYDCCNQVHCYVAPCVTAETIAPETAIPEITTPITLETTTAESTTPESTTVESTITPELTTLLTTTSQTLTPETTTLETTTHIDGSGSGDMDGEGSGSGDMDGEGSGSGDMDGEGSGSGDGPDGSGDMDRPLSTTSTTTGLPQSPGPQRRRRWVSIEDTDYDGEFSFDL